MKYTIVNVHAVSFLEQRIAQYISEGWIPQGGVCVCYEGGDIRYYQAMIKQSQMKNPKYILNRIINAFINGYYGRTPHYWERGKYNKAYKLRRNR